MSISFSLAGKKYTLKLTDFYAEHDKTNATSKEFIDYIHNLIQTQKIKYPNLPTKFKLKLFSNKFGCVSNSQLFYPLLTKDHNLLFIIEPIIDTIPPLTTSEMIKCIAQATNAEKEIDLKYYENIFREKGFQIPSENERASQRLMNWDEENDSSSFGEENSEESLSVEEVEEMLNGSIGNIIVGVVRRGRIIQNQGNNQEG